MRCAVEASSASTLYGCTVAAYFFFTVPSIIFDSPFYANSLTWDAPKLLVAPFAFFDKHLHVCV